MTADEFHSTELRREIVAFADTSSDIIKSNLNHVFIAQLLAMLAISIFLLVTLIQFFNLGIYKIPFENKYSAIESIYACYNYLPFFFFLFRIWFLFSILILLISILNKYKSSLNRSLDEIIQACKTVDEEIYYESM